jgi:hypothetical protein
MNHQTDAVILRVKCTAATVLVVEFYSNVHWMSQHEILLRFRMKVSCFVPVIDYTTDTVAPTTSMSSLKKGSRRCYVGLAWSRLGGDPLFLKGSVAIQQLCGCPM